MEKHNWSLLAIGVVFLVYYFLQPELEPTQNRQNKMFKITIDTSWIADSIAWSVHETDTVRIKYYRFDNSIDPTQGTQ